MSRNPQRIHEWSLVAAASGIIVTGITASLLVALALLGIVMSDEGGDGDDAAMAAIGTGVALAAGGLLRSVHNLHQRWLKSATTDATGHPPQPPRAVRHASRLLPADARNEYLEEWTAWMLDLRTNGTPPIRRWIELLSIVLVAAPRLAIILRAAARQAVDR